MLSYFKQHPLPQKGIPLNKARNILSKSLTEISKQSTRFKKTIPTPEYPINVMLITQISINKIYKETRLNRQFNQKIFKQSMNWPGKHYNFSTKARES
jgi:hypothetical protein